MYRKQEGPEAKKAQEGEKKGVWKKREDGARQPHYDHSYARSRRHTLSHHFTRR